MSPLLRSLTRWRGPALALLALALLLALAAQSQFSRGPGNIREGMVLCLLAIACFWVADWLHAARVAGDGQPESDESSAARTRQQRRRAAEVDDPWLQP